MPYTLFSLNTQQILTYSKVWQPWMNEMKVQGNFPEVLFLKILCVLPRRDDSWMETAGMQAGEVQERPLQKAWPGQQWLHVSQEPWAKDKTSLVIPEQSSSVPLTESIWKAELGAGNVNVPAPWWLQQKLACRCRLVRSTAYDTDRSPRQVAFNSWERKRKHQERFKGDRQKFNFKNKPLSFFEIFLARTRSICH